MSLFRAVYGSRRSGRSGHGLTTFSATKFFYYSLPFKVIAQLPAPLRQHFGTTWPDPFSKADYDPVLGYI